FSPCRRPHAPTTNHRLRSALFRTSPKCTPALLADRKLIISAAVSNYFDRDAGSMTTVPLYCAVVFSLVGLVLPQKQHQSCWGSPRPNRLLRRSMHSMNFSYGALRSRNYHCVDVHCCHMLTCLPRPTSQQFNLMIARSVFD